MRQPDAVHPAPTHTPAIAPSWMPRALLLGMLLLLGACGVVEERDRAPRDPPTDLHRIPDAEPRWEPRSRYGNPESYEVFGVRYRTLPTAEGYVERGVASWYGVKFHGRRTSSQEPYDMYAMTAAHRSLPLPSYVAVTNLENGRRVVVRVNDRGPFHANRIIDLSYAAAVKLGFAERGTGLVEVRAVTPGAPAGPASASRPAPSPVPASGGERPRLFLQVGAFAERGNALRLRERLYGAVGVPVLIASGSDGAPLHRVRLGPVANVHDLDRLVARLAEWGIHDAHVVIQ